MHLRHQLRDSKWLGNDLIHASVEGGGHLFWSSVCGDRDNWDMFADGSFLLILPYAPDTSQSIHRRHLELLAISNLLEIFAIVVLTSNRIISSGVAAE